MAREEKPLRHVAMVAKILDENKPKKVATKRIRFFSRFIDPIQFHLIEGPYGVVAFTVIG